jgi:porphyrinogen peroxidase
VAKERTLMTEPARQPPQPVTSARTGAAIFLVASVKPDGEQAVRALLPELGSLQRSVGARVPDGGLTCVAGIGSAAWDRLFTGPRPAELHPFRELAGAKYIAIATPGDLLLHIRAGQMDLCFELAAQIMERLAGAVTVDDEVHGFRYFDERDLLGFVTGAENPDGAAQSAVLIGGSDARFAGGCYAVVQKYLHDLRAWNALPTQEQEQIIGRSKLSNVELPGARHGRSHLALTRAAGPGGVAGTGGIAGAGAGPPILRTYTPFGNAGRGEFGTYFVGYAASAGIIERMLENMFVGSPPDNYDRILDYSTAVSGGLFFVPSAGFLAQLPDPPSRSAAVRAYDAQVAMKVRT